MKEGKMKALEFCEKVLRRAGEKLRGVWESWSRRKKVTVSVCAVIGVLLLGAVIFCLTVPLFYWWPDGVPIPGTDGTMMFVKESDAKKEYRKNLTASYPDLSTNVDTERPDCIYRLCTIVVEHVRNIDRITNQGIAAESVILAKVDTVWLDAADNRLQEGDYILIYNGDRMGMEAVDTVVSNGVDAKIIYGSEATELIRGDVWEIRIYDHNTLPILESLDYKYIYEDYDGYDYWTKRMEAVSDFYVIPTIRYRQDGYLRKEWTSRSQTRYEMYKEKENFWRDRLAAWNHYYTKINGLEVE